MKNLYVSLTFLTLIFISNTSYAKEMKYSYEVEFGSAKGEKILQFNGNGNLNITGYNGSKILLSSDENIFNDDKENEKAKGLKKIGGGGFNIINNKEKNIIIVSRPGHENVDLDVKVPNDITLKIGTGVTKPSNGYHLSRVQMVAPVSPVLPIAPVFEQDAAKLEKLAKNFEVHTTVIEKNADELQKHADELEKHAKKLEKEAEKLEKHVTIIAPQGKFANDWGGTVSFISHAPFNGSVEGDIIINDFKGLVEASTVQGSITVNDMDGMVLANTVQGDINVTFKKMIDEKELYLSTVYGDVDITFPKNTKADIMAKTIEGDLYSGFDDEVTSGMHPDGKKGKKDSEDYFGNLFQSDYVTTRLNEGGQDVYLNTVKGSIYIRKGK